MNKLLLFLLFIYSIDCNAQTPNPDLFQTWYLSDVATDDGSMGFMVSNITPDISPTLTVMSDLTFNGVGACNTFNGEFSTTNIYPLETIQFSSLTNDCGVTLHNDFENEYFTFMQWVSDYVILPVENGLMLRMFTPPFGHARFFNFPLNTERFELEEVKLYPNPTDSKIHLKPLNSQVVKVEIFNTLGEKLKTKEDDFETVDISDFSNGIYFISIYTNVGVYNEKIIKK